MMKLILDPSHESPLPDFSQPFSVYDNAGKMLGRYFPSSFGPAISRDEIERRKKTKDVSYRTAEVLKRLEQR